MRETLSTSARLLRRPPLPGGAKVGEETEVDEVSLVYFSPLVYLGTPEVEEGAPEKRYDYTLPNKLIRNKVMADLVYYASSLR